MNPDDLGVFVEGFLYGMLLTVILERVVFPLSFRVSRTLDRSRLRH
jgi:hypothetical protein